MSFHLIPKGGNKAHIARRLMHLSMISVPLIYYRFLAPVFSLLTLHRILLVWIFFIVLLEYIRIKNKVVFFGQRQHEATHFSAFGWTMISIAIVLLVLHTNTYAWPIIVSCAVADPLVGEMRLRKIPMRWIVGAGLSVVAAVWFFFGYFFSFPLWMALCMAPITIAVEWPSFRYIDDNALMMLVPLAPIFIFS